MADRRRQDDDEAASADEGPAGASAGRQRVDKWLWHARVVKTRGLAQKLVTDGRVRRNREGLDHASDTVRAGDVLTVTLPGRVLVLRALGFADRRGSAPEAQRLYEDLSPPPPPRPRTPSGAPDGGAPRRDPGSGRPTKRERRSIDALEPDPDEE